PDIRGIYLIYSNWSRDGSSRTDVAHALSAMVAELFAGWSIVQCAVHRIYVRRCLIGCLGGQKGISLSYKNWACVYDVRAVMPAIPIPRRRNTFNLRLWKWSGNGRTGSKSAGCCCKSATP